MQVSIVKNKSVKGYRVVIGERIYLAGSDFAIIQILIRYFDVSVDDVIRLLNRFNGIEMKTTLEEKQEWKDLSN